MIAAEDRTFYTNKGIDPKGILRAAFTNATGNATQGASTITQQYVKILYLTQERTLSRKVKEAFLSLKVQQEQSKDEILEGYLNTIYFGRGAYGDPGRRQRLLRQAGQGADRPASRRCSPRSSTRRTTSTPTGGKASREALHRALRLRARRHGGDRATSPPRPRPTSTRQPAQARQDQGAEPVRRPARPHADAWSRHELHAARVRRHRDRLRRAAGRHDVHQEGDGRRRAGRARASARGLEEAARRGRLGRPETGALRGIYAGQDYLESQLNWAVAGGVAGLGVQAVRPRRRAQATASPEGHLRRQLAATSSPTAPRSSTRATATGNDYGSAISLLTATEDSVNTAYVDLADACRRAREGPRHGGRHGHPAQRARASTPNLEHRARARPRSARSTWPTPTAPSPTAARAKDCSSSRRSTGARTARCCTSTAQDRPGDLRGRRRRHVSYALQQVVAAGTGTNAHALGRPAAGKTGTATNDDGDVPRRGSSATPRSSRPP